MLKKLLVNVDEIDYNRATMGITRDQTLPGTRIQGFKFTIITILIKKSRPFFVKNNNYPNV